MTAEVLKDVLSDGLYAVFCGTAVGDASRRANAYYAGPGNRFWPTLAKTGLTAVTLGPDQYVSISDYRLGLSDIVKDRSGSDASPAASDFDVEGFHRKIQDNAPAIVAFNGKTAARKALGLRNAEPIDYGRHTSTIHGAIVWVLPSTSRAASGEWDERHWQKLADESKRLSVPTHSVTHPPAPPPCA